VLICNTTGVNKPPSIYGTSSVETMPSAHPTGLIIVRTLSSASFEC
jgi:hypothetical protein